LATPLINAAYSQTVQTSGGTAPIAFAITAGSLPAGLTLNASTGAISGTPTTAGAYTFTVTATDTNSVTSSKTYSGTIASALSITTATLATPLINAAYSQTVQTSGGTAPIAFAITAGSLPAGLTLNASTGAITGTPTAAGAYAFTITATDANSVGASQAYSGTIVSALAITTATLPTPLINQSYSQTVQASGGTGPVTFAITVGSLPSGLSLNASTGVISGTPGASGAYNFTVTATDANSVTATQSYSGTIVAALAITTVTLPVPIINTAYSQTVQTSGGTSPVAFAISSGALPAGLNLNASTGVVSGAPTTPGAYAFTVKVTDANSVTATQSYSGTIVAAVAITTATLPTPLINTAYSQTVQTSGGTAPVSFTITSGALPAGLALNAATGAITGTPSTPGAYAFTVKVTDANSVTASQAYSGTIVSALAITTATLPTPVISTAYNQSVQTSGGTSPVTFSISAGALPSGLSLNASTGAITGTPATAGAYTFTISATDANSIIASQAYSGTIAAALAITTATLPVPVINTVYSQTVHTTGGTAPIGFAVTGGTLPAGLSLNASSGVIGGTPTASGAYSFTVTATDANGLTSAVTYSGTIDPPLVITTTTISTPEANQPYSQTIQTTGGAGPYAFAITGGSLPAGLTLNHTTGAISGTPAGSGAYSFTVTVTDANGTVTTHTYTLTVAAALAITTLSLPAPVINTAYAQTVQTSGGNAPVSFAITAGTLPAGLTLNASTGAITGTAAASGAYAFTVTATDANSVTAAQAYSGTIAPPLQITSTALSTPEANQAYSQTIQTTGGVGPYAFTVTGGALPAGLILNPVTGVVSGTPTGSGAYSFTVTVTDANGTVTSHTYSGTIVAALAITTLTLPAPIINVAYSQTVQTSGGNAPIAFSINAGSLPAGLTLNASTGVISGTPAAAGAYSFTVSATDSNAVVATQAYSGTIAAALVITTLTLPTPVIGKPYTQTVQTSGGTAPIVFAVTGGALPAGLTLNASTGVVSGTPTGSGSYSFTIKATDANGTTSTVTYSGTIAAALAVTTLTLPVPVIGTPYSQTVQTTGGTAPIAFAVTAGSLPAGIALNASSGVVSGTATTAGAYSFTVTATDANGLASSATYSGTIAPPVAIVTPALPTPEAGQPYSQTVQTTGGTPPLTFALTGGALPAGLTLNTATGVISGTVTAAGPYSFTITVTDANGKTSTVTYTGTVSEDLAITTITIPTPIIGQAYNQPVQTQGGVAPFTFSITAGALPPGLTLDPTTGVLSGTLSTPGPYSFTVTVVDALGVKRSVQYSGVVLAAVAITPASLPSGMVGVPYSQTITVTGGLPPYQLSIVSGALPAGLSFNTTSGVISGRPTTAQTATFTVQAKDTNGTIATMAYSLQIAPRPDPSQNADVRGLVAAQTSAMSRFAAAQSDNITRHLEDLHSGARCGNNVQLQITDAAPRPVLQGDSASAQPSGSLPVNAACPSGNVNAWIAGALTFGSDQQSGASSLDFHTDGVTVGVDAHLSKTLLAGFALGGAFDGTSIGTNGTSLRAGSFDAAAYASYHPSSNLYLDGLLGLNNATFKDNRWNQYDSSFVPGTRTAHGTFATLLAGYEFRNGHLEYAPYLRADAQWAQFNAMAESSNQIWGLSFAPMQTTTSTLTGGVRTSYEVQTPFGLLSPEARLELRNVSNGQQTQNLMYQDGLGPTYVILVPGTSQGALAGSFGLRFNPNAHTVFMLDYDFMSTKGSLQHTLRPYINLSF
jgi:hypothetical protein